MSIQIGNVSEGSINVAGLRVACPKCQNGSCFNRINLSGATGRMTCGSCFVRLVIRDGRIEIES